MHQNSNSLEAFCAQNCKLPKISLSDNFHKKLDIYKKDEYRSVAKSLNATKIH